MDKVYIAYWCDRQWNTESVYPQASCRAVESYLAVHDTIYCNESTMLFPTWEAFEAAS